MSRKQARIIRQTRTRRLAGMGKRNRKILMTFSEQLEKGQLVESKIAKWLAANEYTVLPVYDTSLSQKAPTLKLPTGTLTAPDLLVIKNKQFVWLEAKQKDVFSWYRIGQRWVTGIDLRHYADYQQIERETRRPVFLAFLHTQTTGTLKEPYPCPTGLYIRKISILARLESHQSPKWGTSGMVYWADTTLHKIATLKEVYSMTASSQLKRLFGI